MSSEKYEEALRKWGERKLHTSGRGPWGAEADSFDLVTVSTYFNEGYACCGGADPLCYCSFYESPSASVEVRGLGHLEGVQMGEWQYRINLEDFDFVTFLAEVLEAGE